MVSGESGRRMVKIIHGPLQPSDDIPDGYMLLQLGAEVYGVPDIDSWRHYEPNDYEEYLRNYTSFGLWLRWQFFLYLGKEGYRELCRPEGVRSWPIWPRAEPSQREIDDEFERLNNGYWWLGIEPEREGSRLQFPGPIWAPSEFIHGPLQPSDDIPEGYTLVQLGAEIYGVLDIDSWRHDEPNDYEEYTRKFTSFVLWLRWQFFLYLGKKRYRKLCRPEGVRSWPIWPRAKPSQREIEDELERLNNGHWWLGIKPGGEGSRLRWASSKHKPQLETYSTIGEIIRGPIQSCDDIPEGYIPVQLGAEVYGVPDIDSWRHDKPKDYEEYTRKFASFVLWLRWQFFLYLGKKRYRELCRPEGVRSWPIWPRAEPSQREIEDESERLLSGHWCFGIKPGGKGSRLRRERKRNSRQVMDVETQASSVDVQLKDVNDAKVIDVSLAPSQEERGPHLEENSNPTKMTHEGDEAFSAERSVEASKDAEEEEVAFDGEFIKVERESIDTKENIHIHSGKEAIDYVADKNLGHHHFLELQEKVKTLEQDLERMSSRIETSETEKSEVQREYARIKEILEEKTHHAVDLELKQKHLNEQLESAELQIKQYEKLNHSQFEALETALKSQDSFQKELADSREEANILHSQLESSRKRNQELEEEVTTLATEAKKDSEFQNLLELANANAKEMEHQISFLQEEISNLYGRIADNQKAEDTLKNTLVELCAVQDELRLSKAHTMDLEQKVAFGEGVIKEVEEQLNLAKQSEEILKHDFVALEKLLATSKEDLLVKITELGGLDSKLMEEQEKILILETELRNQEAQTCMVQEELDTMTKLKADEEATVSALDSKLSHMQELVADLENRLNQSIEKCAESDSHLEKVLSYNNELEQKLKSLQGLHDESESRTADAVRLNLEYQNMLQEEESKLKKTESELVLLTQKNSELEEQLNSAATERNDTDKVVKELQEKISEFSEMLRKVEEEYKLLETEIVEHKDRKSYLESALEESSGRRCDLENELKIVTERCMEHEGRATSVHQRSLELEDMIQVSHSKSEDAGKRVSELQLLVESSEQKRHELEEYLRSTEGKYMEVEAESKHYSSKCSEISAELEAACAKLSSLELSLQNAKEKELELTESLRETREERESFADKINNLELDLEKSYMKNRELEDNLNVALQKCVEHEGHANSSHQRSLELENLMEISQSKAEIAERKVVELEMLLKSSEEKQHELEEHLRSTEKKLVDVEEECKSYSCKVSRLSDDLEESLRKASSFELLLSDANAKDIEFKEQLALVMAERKSFEDKVKQLMLDLDQSSLKTLELEQGLKVLAEKCAEHEGLANMHHQRCLELEGLIETSESKTEAAKVECETYTAKISKLLGDLETSLLKISNLEVALHDANEKEMEMMKSLELFIADQKTSEAKIKQLENELDILSSRNLDLEQELKVVTEKCMEHEGRADQIHHRSLELEDLIQVSNSQAQDTERRVGELEILLKTSEQTQQEFEEQLASAKAECRQYDAKLSELSLELEASLANASSLQAALGDANETVESLKKSIHLLTEEKKAFEDASDAYGAKLSHVESLLELLQQELKMTQEKFITVESDLEIATQKEAETAMKLKLSEEQVDQQRLLMQESAAKCQELELLYEDANMKLQNEVEKFVQRDSAAKELLDKVNALEKEAAARQEQAVEASSCNQDLQAQLEEQLKKMISLENYCDELKSKLLESESQVSASSSENEILVETNLKLKEELKVYHEKVSQLETVLQALQTEKEATIEEVKFHKNNIDELTDKHARALQLYSDSESHIMDIEQKLHEAIEKCTLRDLEAKELNENMQSLETQLKTHKEDAENAERVIEFQKVEMEQVRSSLAHLEGTLEELQNRSNRLEAENESLAEANLDLNEKIAAYQTEISGLQVVLNTVQTEKSTVVEQLSACEKTIHDLAEQRRAEGHELQSQMSSIMTESHSLSETYEKSRKEFQILRSELEEKLKEGKAREDGFLLEIENLRAEVADRSTLLSRIGLLEQELASSEAQLKEQKEMEARKDTDKESTLKDTLAELEAKDHQTSILQRQIEEHKQQLEQSNSMLKMKEEKIRLINAELESSKIKTNQIAELEKKIEDLEIELQSARLNPEIQSRGIANLGVGASPSKRKSKKKSEAAATQTVQGSPLMGFKLVVAVALISLIIGLLLGRGN